MAEPFLCGLGDFSAPAFFFFFDLGDASFAGLFFGFGCVVGSGVSLGVGEASDSSGGFFFFFGFGDGVGDFFFLDALFFGFGLGDSSSDVDLTARALRTGVAFSSSVCCACRTKLPISALSTKKVGNQTRKRPTATQRNRVLRAINRQRIQNALTPAAMRTQPFQTCSAFLVHDEELRSACRRAAKTNR